MPNLRIISPIYLAELQKLNLYSPTNVYDLNNSTLDNVASSIYNFISNGNSNFDTSILGNELLPNTPIAQIGKIELAKNLALRFSNNLRTNLLPTINISTQGINVNDPNYWNISNNTKIDSLSSLLQIMTGFQTIENPIPKIGGNFDNKASDQYLKQNRGQGQIDSYLNNVGQNDSNPDVESSYYNFDVPSILAGTSPNSILYKTQQIINDNNLINGYPSSIEILEGNSLSPDALAYVDPNNLGTLISNGDGTFTDDSRTKFLRVYNKNKTYSGTTSLMKFKHGYAGSNSVLQTVFPNISPLLGDTNIKNLMFSIENLAYVDNILDLKSYEIGINGGRIMWFPPYNLKITEEESVDWQNEKFIGRSEPIYTYNSNERTVSFGFTLIVDYPSQFADNSWKNASNNEFDKFFRQDNTLNLNRTFTTNQINQLEVIRQQQTPLNVPKQSNTHISNFENNNKLTIHFDNDKYNLSQLLTADNSNGDGQKDNNDFFNRINDLISFLNTDEGKFYKIYIDGFASTLFSNKFSSAISTKYNDILSYLRGRSIYQYILNNLNDKSNPLADYNNIPSSLVSPKVDQYNNPRFIIAVHGSTNAINSNDTNQTIGRDVVDRKSTVYISYNPELDESFAKPPEDKDSQLQRLNDANLKEKDIANNNISGGEVLFFQRLKNDDDKALILDKYSERLDYFSPIFHSQTPEDFNSRLTFLSQCTKQGNAISGITNSIFGRPPVCILRIGDFYYTKVIITNITKEYEPLVWDMNPEGIGMQPMLCNVKMSVKLIGGQSLDGVITKLQNALDYNFYANTQVYNSTALKGASESIIINNSGKGSSVSQNSTERVKTVTNQVQQSLLNNTKPLSTTFGNVLMNTKVISYNEKYSDIIEFLTNWSDTLFFIESTAPYNQYLISGSDNVDINSYNNYYSTLNAIDKNSNYQNYITINGFYKKINQLKLSYNTDINILNTIVQTGKDGSYSLVSGSELNNFFTMNNNVNNFYNNYLLNISKGTVTNDDINKQLIILTKYNNYTLSSIPYTS